MMVMRGLGEDDTKGKHGLQTIRHREFLDHFGQMQTISSNTESI